MEFWSEPEEDLPEDFPDDDLLPPDLEEEEEVDDPEEEPDLELAFGVEEDLLLPSFLLLSDKEEEPFLEVPEELPVVEEREVPELPKPDPEPLSPMLLVVEPVMRCELPSPRLASESELLPMLPDDEEEALASVLPLELEDDPRLLFCCSF